MGFFSKNNLIKISILVFAGLVIYFSRQIFSFRYDPVYYENWYYHSQWNIPNSTRGIGDGDLYKFSGYVLANGGNPFDINYPVPPFGKWIYGLAEKYNGNPYLVSIVLYLLSIYVMFRLSDDVLKNRNLALLSVLLFTVTPFVASQVRETMLDLPLMFLFLTHLYFFNKYLSDKKIISLLLAGIFLGLATGTKIGIYSPLIFIFGLIILFLNNKKIFELFKYTIFTGIGYVLAYTCYFLKHPNPIPWIRLQEKQIGFYFTASNGKFDHLAQWKGIFLNRYQGFWQPGVSINLGDWSLLLPIGVLAAVIVLITSIKKKQLNLAYLSIFVMIFLSINTLIPFFPRYLMSVIPVLVLLTTCLLRQKKYLIIGLVILSLPPMYYSVVFNPVENQERDAIRFTTTLAYHDLYRILIPENQKNISETDFINTNEYFYQTIGVKKISMIRQNIISENNTDVKIKYQISYDTIYGLMNFQPVFEYQKINNQWQLVWNWNYLASDFSPETKLDIKESGKSDKWAVYVAAHYLSNWNDNIQSIAKVTGLDTGTVDNEVRLFVPDFYPRFVGFLDPKLGSNAVQIAQSTAGVTLKKVKVN